MTDASSRGNGAFIKRYDVMTLNINDAHKRCDDVLQTRSDKARKSEVAPVSAISDDATIEM